MRSGSMDGSIYLTSSATQRKWTERQYLLCSTLAPAMASILAVSVRYTCDKTRAAYVSFGRWRKQEAPKTGEQQAPCGHGAGRRRRRRSGRWLINYAPPR